MKRVARKEILYVLKWPELIKGKLIRRYKRFLADVELETGDIVTAHCANSGSMKECSTAGQPVYLSIADNPNRKLKYTWELIEMPTSLVGTNTSVPNRFVKQAVLNGLIPELLGYDEVKSEVSVSANSRLDLVLTSAKREACYIEIKNCSLVTGGLAMFPDAVTQRGAKHLHELIRLKKEGFRTVSFYLIQRMDAVRFSPARAIDPNYADVLKEAMEEGIEVLVYDTWIDLVGIQLRNRLPVDL